MTACRTSGDMMKDLSANETVSAIYDEYHELFEIETIIAVEFPHALPPKRNKSPSFPRSRKERRDMRRLR